MPGLIGEAVHSFMSPRGYIVGDGVLMMQLVENGRRHFLHWKGWKWNWPVHALLCLTVCLFLIQVVPAMAEGEGLISVDYEVFGKVQKVFFRKHTQVCVLCP